MKALLGVVKVLPLALLVGCCLFRADTVQAGTWSAPNYFSTGSGSDTSGGTTFPYTTTNTGEISSAGSGSNSATLRSYGVMIYSATSGDSYPLPCPPVNTVQYTLTATAWEDGSGSNTPCASAFNGQAQAMMTVTGGYFGYTATADISGTYNVRNYTLTQDKVNNQWILTGPVLELSASYGGGAESGELDLKMSGMTWN